MARSLTWAFLSLFGAAAFIIALDFGRGAGPRIGSAALPLILSGGIVLISILGLVVPGLDGGEKPFNLRPFAAIVASVVLFILTADGLGLIPATLLTMFAAYLGQGERRFAGFLLYAALFAIAIWLIFAVGLGLPIAAFGGR